VPDGHSAGRASTHPFLTFCPHALSSGQFSGLLFFCLEGTFKDILMNTFSKILVAAVGLCGFASVAVAQTQASSYAVSQRKAVVVSAVEHAHLLTEMNAFLSTLHDINTALSAKDFERVASLAKAMGPKGGQHDAVGESLHKALPAEWFQLARPTHQAFLAIAQEASQNPTVDAVLAKVAVTTQQCVACHSAFRLEIRP
jgi:cytochrome c556